MCFIYQGRRNGFGIGGGQKKICAAKPRKFFFYITLTYKRDIIFFISISVISKFTELSVYFILIYIHLFISHYFSNLNFLGWQNIGGAIAPPCPPVPTAMYIRSHACDFAAWANSMRFISASNTATCRLSGKKNVFSGCLFNRIEIPTFSH